MLAARTTNPHLVEPDVCAPIDANGNLTNGGTTMFLWNALNQLVEVKQGTTTLATFEYDGAGRRTEKVAAGVTHTYVYDAEDIVEERLTGSTTDTIRYYHGAGIDEPLARKDSSEVVTYYLADHLGSVVQETNASGAVTLDREYDPWGVALQGASTSGYAFTGREWDAETGLAFYRARYYSPPAGRFISEDPLGFAAGSQGFATYVDNAPTRFVDPSGTSILALVVPIVVTGTAPAWVGPAVIVGGVIATTIAVERFTRPYRVSDGSESKPNNCPSGTLPIDQAKRKFGLDKDDVHTIKDQLDAGPRTWTGIDPDGNVWTGGPKGVGENHGPLSSFLPGSQR